MNREWSIQTSLQLLVAAIVVPLVGAEAYAIWQATRASAERAEQSAQSVGEAASASVEQLLEDADTALAALARWESRTEPDRETCTRHVTNLKEATPQLYQFTILDADGSIFCTSGEIDLENAPTAADRAWFQQVMRARTFTVSKPIQGRVSGLWISVFARPIVEDGSVTGVAISSLDLSRFSDLLGGIPMPQGGLLTLAHVDGTVVARSRDAEEWVGRRLPGSQRPDTLEYGVTDERLMERPGVIPRAVTGEGDDLLFAWVPVPKAEWVLYAGFPLDWVYGPVRREARNRALVLIGVLLLASIIAFSLYRQISGALQGLITDTEKAAAGRESRVRVRGPTEVRRVARQFNRTLEARDDAERDLRTAQERMRQRQKLEAVGRLAGGVAHDFNNLLTVIQGEASLLTDEGVSAEERRQGTEEIIRASEQAAELVQKLLTFSRQDQARARPVDANRVIRRMEKVIRSLLTPTVDVKIDLAEDAPRVRADGAQLEQVLMNLVVNARDAMPDGGAVEIRTELTVIEDDPATDGDGGPTPGRYLALTVSDTGTGMSPDVRSRVFEPFYTTKDREQGTGLGLSAVYGIVTGWGGQVTVESSEGEGSTFTAYLPVAGSEAEAKN